MAGVLSAVMFSLPPALENCRRDLSPAMKGTVVGRRWRGDVYSLVQVAFSLALLIATVLLLRALYRAETLNPGFAADHRLYVNLMAPPDKFPTAQAAQLYTSLLAQARALPGVRDATLEFGSGDAGCAAAAALAPPRKLQRATVEPNYFAVLRVPVVKGAPFPATGGLGEATEAVINETMARIWWPGENALGKTLWLGCQPGKQGIGQVAGIVRDRHDLSLDENPQPFLYLSRRQSEGSGFARLIVWTTANPYRWAKPLLRVAQSGGPNLSIFDVQSLEDEASRSLWELKWQASLLGGVGLLAAVLAAIGLYGVVAYSVSRRTHEIGIRMALGAAPADVQRMVLGLGLRITAAGIACGLLVSAATVRLLRGFLYGMSPFDTLAFAAGSVAWLAIAMLASWLPARRATRVDPGVALKWE
jgi:predicted permease